MSSSNHNSNCSPFQSISSIGLVVSGYFLWQTRKRVKKIEEKNEPTEKKSTRISDVDSESSVEVDPELMDRLNVYETRVTLLEKKFSSMASHEKRISNLGVRVSGMQDYGQRLFQVEHRDLNHGDAIRSVEQRIDTIDREVSSNTNSVRNHNQRLNRIEMEKPVYTFFPGPSNGSHTGPNGIIQGILGGVHEPPIILTAERPSDSDTSPELSPVTTEELPKTPKAPTPSQLTQSLQIITPPSSPTDPQTLKPKPLPKPLAKKPTNQPNPTNPGLKADVSSEKEVTKDVGSAKPGK
jgi:hypothetical protein